MVNPIECRSIAMRIAALLPPDRESADSVLGLVEDLRHWQGAPTSPQTSAERTSAMASEAEAGFVTTSYDLALRQFRRLDALAQLVALADENDNLKTVDGLDDLLKDAARAAGDILELMLAEREGKNG